MKRKAAIVFSLLFLLVGALAFYSECAHAANHFDVGAGHEAPSLYCPNAFLNSSSQAASAIQFHSRSFSKLLPALDAHLGSAVLLFRFEDHPFLEPFSRQDLFRFEEVYRL